MIGSILWLLFISSSLAQKYRFFDDFPFDMNDEVASSSGITAVTVYRDDQSMNSDQKNDLSEAMEQFRLKMAEASQNSLSQLQSVLMLNSTSQTFHALRSRIDDFQDSLMISLKDDLSFMLEEFKQAHVDDVVQDEDKYEFTQRVQEKWEETTSQHLQVFHEKVLPGWLVSVRHVWTGIENIVMEKMKKFKKFLEKMAPQSFTRCQRNESLINASGKLESPSGFEIARSNLWNPDVKTGRTMLFIGFVALIIWLSLVVPYLAIFLAGIFIADVIIFYLLR